MVIETKPPVDSARFTAAMGLAPTAVYVVTTDGACGRFGLTVSAVSSVSADPPLVLVCINRRSPAAAAIDGNRAFAVSLLAAANQSYAETFSGRPREGKPFDFANHRWRLGETGLPLVQDATANFECDIHQHVDAGTHRIFIGRVIAAHSGSDEPLVYCNRLYRRIIHNEESKQ